LNAFIDARSIGVSETNYSILIMWCYCMTTKPSNAKKNHQKTTTNYLAWSGKPHYVISLKVVILILR